MRDILLLIVIIAVGALVRLYQIGQTPYGYAYDEAAIVYDAWSISLWHRDQYANLMPLAFKSFGDYKPPLLIYMLASIYTFTGLQEIFIRYISAFAGIGSICIMYFLARLITKSNSGALAAAAVTAFSPWSIHLSRVGFEQNLTFFLGLLGIFFYWKSYQKLLYLGPGLLFMTLSIYTFHTAKIFIPLAFIVIAVHHQELSTKKIKTFLMKLVLFIVLLAPMMYSLIFAHGNERAGSLFIFNSQGSLKNFPSIVSTFFVNTVNQLSPAFWASGWDAVSIRHSTPGYGVLLWPSYLLLLLAIPLTIMKRHTSIIYLWLILIIGILPSIIGQITPHVLRSQFGLIGASLLIGWTISIIRSRFILAIFLAATLVNTGMYINRYFNSYAKESAVAYQFGYKEALEFIKEYQDIPIVITTKYEQPYIYTLLYNRITPQSFLWGGLNNFTFREISWPEASGKIYLASPEEISPHDPSVIKTITIPNTNTVAWVIAKP